MIKGKSVTRVRENMVDCRVEYRKIDALNYSSVKDFDNDPVKFYNEFILKKKRKGKAKSTALILGDLVDFHILECGGDDEIFLNRFDEKFALFEAKKGSGQAILLADELFLITQESLNSQGEIVVSFMDRFTEALNKMKAKEFFKGKSVEDALMIFETKAMDYFQLQLDNSCKTVVEVSLVDKAKKIAGMILTDPFTKDLFENGDIEYYPKLSIEWLYKNEKGREIKCKSEVDMLHVDHFNKTIYLRDIKTNYDNESFEMTYLRFGYYIQAGFYYLAVEYWAKQNGLDHYTIAPMEFIVGDTSSNNRRPIRFRTSFNDLDASLNGFSIRGNYYKGIHRLIEEIGWAEETGQWNVSKDVVDNEGKLLLNINYDNR